MACTVWWKAGQALHEERRATLFATRALPKALIGLVISSQEAMPAGGRLLAGKSSVVLEEIAVNPTVRAPSFRTCCWPSPPRSFPRRGTGKGAGLGLASTYGVLIPSLLLT